MGNVTRMDVIYPRTYERKDGQPGTDWLRVGVAWMKPNGEGDIILYALPVGGTEKPGECRLVLKPSEGREQRQGGQQGGGQRGPEVHQRRPPQDRRPNDRFQGDPGPGYSDGPDGSDDLPF